MITIDAGNNESEVDIMTTKERIDACREATNALSVVIGAIIMGDETTAKKYLDEAFTFIDDLYDEYNEFEDDEDEEDEQPEYVTEFIAELEDMCDYYDAECKISIDFGDGECYEVEVSNDD